MLNKTPFIALIVGALVLPLAAMAQPKGVTSTAAGKGGVVSVETLITRYTPLAGSEANAKSLVNGVRSMQEIVLTGKGSGGPFGGGGVVTVKFMPVTDVTGLGNIDIALALVEADLGGRSLPSTMPLLQKFQLLQAALNGGSVKLSATNQQTFEGILKLRLAGQGWGEIAKKLGFDLK